MIKQVIELIKKSIPVFQNKFNEMTEEFNVKNAAYQSKLNADIHHDVKEELGSDSHLDLPSTFDKEEIMDL